jgi:hypothetical protein
MIVRSFDNKTIKPLRDDKPHVVYRKGYWRVSSYRHSYYSQVLTRKEQADIHMRFMLAHAWVHKANRGLIIGLNEVT